MISDHDDVIFLLCKIHLFSFSNSDVLSSKTKTYKARQNNYPQHTQNKTI